MRNATPSKSKEHARHHGAARVQALAIVLGLAGAVVTLSRVSPEQLEEWPQLCLWSRLVGRPCLACGTTRALCCLAHGDLYRALTYNRNVLLLAPALLWIWVGQIRTLCQLSRHSRSHIPAARPENPRF